MSEPDYTAIRIGWATCPELAGLNLTSVQISDYIDSLTNPQLVRSRKLGCLVLPTGISWSNRHNWHPIRRVMDVSVSGKVILWEHELLNGRRIELSSVKESGWWTPESLPILYAMASSTGTTFTYTWDDYEATVVFDHTDGAAVELEKVHPNYDYYYGTVRLLVV